MSTERSRQKAEHVVLRPIRAADLPALFAFQLDPEANRMAAVHPRDEASFTAVWERSLADPGVTARAIMADGVLAGSISCFKLDGLPAVGYWIAREHWGRGIATRALALLLEEVPTRPLHARAARDNPASLRVLQNCGFVVTGYTFSAGTDRYVACEEAVLILR